MPKPLFQVPYHRPKQLSDPFHDFTPIILNKILETPDSLLKWYDYQNLLGPHLPAGTYEEVIYFLPRAFDFILAHDEDALDVITSIVGFASKNNDKLQADAILEPTRLALKNCLIHWTSTFHVHHFDLVACQAKGWGLKHYDIVKHSQLVSEALHDLIKFQTHLDIAQHFVYQIAHNNADLLKAAWFLEIANTQIIWPKFQLKEKSIQSLLTNYDLLKQASNTVLEQLFEKEPSPTYWNDTFASLAL